MHVTQNEEKELFEYTQLNLEYSELLSEIHKDIELNIFYQENLKKNSRNFPNFKDYLPYILDDEATENELSLLFHLYKNYGVCKRLEIKTKKFAGEALLKVFFQRIKIHYL